MPDPDKSRAKAQPDDAKATHPGMLGDGTEEQNLNQPGKPDARITEGEVKQAFGKPDKKLK